MIGAAKAKVRLIRQILAESSAPRSCDKIFKDMITATLYRMPMEAVKALVRAPFIFFGPLGVFGAAFPFADMNLPQSAEFYIVFLSERLLYRATSEEACFTIAHELAHVLLRHGYNDPAFTDDIALQLPRAEADEREADELVSSWGFKTPQARQEAKNRGDLLSRPAIEEIESTYYE